MSHSNAIKKENNENFQIIYGSEAIQPIQLISFNEKKEIYIHEDAIAFFSKLNDVNFATISVVGKYRTGKSYLLNRVLLDRSDGFSVGPTINPCTKGLWIWPSLIEVVNNQQKTKILVIDTEGIGACHEEENHDMKIFLLAMLLSSFFVYNSVGNIDEMAIQNLSLIINLGKHLQKTNDKEFDDLISVFPNFLWIVRDFALKLIDTFGNTITSREYLENALKAQKGTSETAESKNRIRRLITSFFKERDCGMLVRPLQNENDIQNLSKIPFKDLRPEFVTQVLNLRKKIFSKIKPKSFKGKLVNGNTFVQMCKIFCDSINKGEIPSIQNSWNSVCKLECQRLVYSIIERYTSQMDDIMNKSPIDFNILQEKHKEIKKICLNDFTKNSYGDDKPFFNEELVNGIKLKHQEYIHLNTNSFTIVLKEYFENKFNLVLEELQNNKVNSLADIERHIKNLKLDLESHFENSPQIFNTLNSLLFEAVLSLTQKFLNIDHNLSKKNDILNENKIKRLEEKIELFIKEKESNSKLLNDKILELETQKSNYFFQQKKQLDKKDKLLEEKNKENETLKIEIEEIKKDARKNLDENEKNKKNKEERENAINLLNIEYSKKMALLQQNSEFLQNESILSKEKILDLEEIITILKENIENLSNEKMLLEEKIMESNKEKYDVLLKDYKIQELKNKELLKEKERLLNNWKIEKEYLGKELLIAKSQLEENKKNNELILKSLNTSRRTTVEHSSDNNLNMLKANKNLSIALEKSEARYTCLEKKIEKISHIPKLMKFCSNFECKICMKFFNFEQFQIHLGSCTRGNIEQIQAINYEVKYETSEENKFKKEFDIEISYQKKNWSLKKTFKTFRHWASELSKSFPQIKSKPFYLSFATKLKKDITLIKANKQDYFEAKRVQITNFLDEICKISEIRNSKIFETFLAFDIHIKIHQKIENHQFSSFTHTSFSEPENILEMRQRSSSRNDRSLTNNKENMNVRETSNHKIKTLNESRNSLKNISFKELYNDVNNKLSSSSKNNFALMPVSTKLNTNVSNKHLSLLSMKTPRSTAFYASKDYTEENINDKTIIRSPLNIKEHEFTDNHF